MDLEKLAYIAIVKNHLAGLVANVSVVTRDKKRQADAKITELDKMFLDEVLGLNPIQPNDEKPIYLSPADRRLMNGVEAAQAILNDLVKSVVTKKEVEQIVDSQVSEGKENYKQLKADVKNAEMTDEEAEQYAKDLAKEKAKLKKAGKTNKKASVKTMSADRAEQANKRVKAAQKEAFLDTQDEKDQETLDYFAKIAENLPPELEGE